MSRRIDEVLVLLRVPSESAERGLQQIAEDLTAIAWELDDASYLAGGPAVEQIHAAHRLVDEAAGALRERFDVRHQGKLAALEVLCAHCGHDSGDHLVEGPHACEHEEDMGFTADEKDARGEAVEVCGCAGFVPPGRYRDTMRTLNDADTIPPPAAGEEHEAAL